MMEEIKIRTELTRVIMDVIERGFTIEDFKRLLDTRVKLQAIILKGKNHKKNGDCNQLHSTNK